MRGARATDGERGLKYGGVATGYRAHVLMFSYIGLVIFAHAAHARVGKENFQYHMRSEK